MLRGQARDANGVAYAPGAALQMQGKWAVVAGQARMSEMEDMTVAKGHLDEAGGAFAGVHKINIPRDGC